MEELIKLIPSQRSVNSKLSRDGYTFVINRKIQKDDGDIFYWKCELNKKCDVKCKSTAITKEMEGKLHRVQKLDSHNHEPNPLTTQLAEIRNKLKKKASESKDIPIHLIQEIKASCSVEVGANLPTKDAMRQVFHHLIF